MIPAIMVKNVSPIVNPLPLKTLLPVSFEYADENISASRHSGFIAEDSGSVCADDIAPLTVAAIKNIYSVLDEKYYELPFTKDDFLAVRNTASSGKPITGAVQKILSLTPVIDPAGDPNFLKKQIESNMPELSKGTSIDYLGMIVFLAAAVKELKQQLDFLKHVDN